MMKRVLFLSLVFNCLAISLAGMSCLPGMREDALLIGAVTIGPITPLERPGECPPVPPEVFSSRYLIIYDESGKNLVREVYFTQIDGGATGYFAATIGAGTYTVDINRNGIDRAANFPMKLTVSKDETITINVDIDTGIR
jgi:hypothetical protein